uniref:Inner membrane-spanning protein YciB n=1 Tax=Candidatus Aschnera chinzeii TaxID=1485666 RepID=A0AAT9G4I3_9ENTR|nr:MAG: septation protein A [Candidatus Aschnera chinzeii]
MLKYLIDFIPLIIFFVTYKKFDIFYASGALIIATLLSTLLIYLIYKKIDRTSIITLFIVIVFSGLTLLFHNDNFIKWKVTIIYTIFSISLLFSQLITNKPIIQRLLEGNIQLSNRCWKKLNLLWVCFFMICALVNLYIAFWCSRDIWVNFKVFGLTIFTIIFTIFSIFYIYKNILKK